MTEHLDHEPEFFHKNGYLIRRSLVTGAALDSIKNAAIAMAEAAQPPAEYEADVHYEGAPQSRDHKGGQTVRRFLDVFDREPAFAKFGSSEKVKSLLTSLMNDSIYLVRSHHNSLMTKNPKYSSQTNWHRDIRYWHYEHENLISVWLALGHEAPENGALMLIPGSHRLEFERQNFDEKMFFKKDLPENEALINSAIMADLAPGDVLFFHCRTLHAASQNSTDVTKHSLVFTYRPGQTKPLKNTRSSLKPDEKI